MDFLTQYGSPPTNYLSTTLFLSYIASALYLTFSISISLHAKYTAIFHAEDEPTPESNPKSKSQRLASAKEARKRHIQIYAMLSGIIFASLSYRMLHFLTLSFYAWRSEKSHLGKDVPISGGEVGAWMLETSLFDDFAHELVRDGPSAVWAQLAILGTWFWGLWMATKATQRRFTDTSMLPYILLGQVLPISFTASLFVIRLHLESPDIAPADPSSKPAPRKLKKRASLTLPTLLLNASLLCLPRLQNHEGFMLLVLFARLVLLVPFSGRVSLKDSEVMKSMTVSGGFVAANLAMMRKTVPMGDVARGLKTGGEALGALGWDAVLGTALGAVLGWGGGV
ncbi:hypothetical protein BS50DRAFT_478408 [Corynespora cassiicola Philippines]|uniref:Uncharacterized protein n=1 Tax=Corynespora cassiicola Philippines TaxID=1448308 RepID=A0A2T2PDB8_CORCC|nr:hypothetical protein BS50DRAFT_478408 [Corynespora cassiicola Philippines]